MHFALPPRKTSQPPPFARVHARSAANARRRNLQLLSYVVLGLLTIYLLIHYLSPSNSTSTIPDSIPPNPTILITTILDPTSMSPSYISMIRANRDDYAARHNYLTFYTNTTLYTHLTSPSPQSWTLVPSLRHALKLHPQADYIWSLHPHALITNPSLPIHTHILSNLSSLMEKDIPVVPPDSVIHTYSHLTPASASLILSQDMDNLAHTSFLLKHSPTSDSDQFAEYLLDAWFDPLYRSYAFHLADLHALEHLVQWHPTITAKLALVPQRLMNGYNFATAPRKLTDDNGHTLKVVDENGNVQDAIREHDSMWAEGDLIVNFKGCAEAPSRNCEKEMEGYYKRWEKEVQRLDGRQADEAVRLPVEASNQ